MAQQHITFQQRRALRIFHRLLSLSVPSLCSCTHVTSRCPPSCANPSVLSFNASEWTGPGTQPAPHIQHTQTKSKTRVRPDKTPGHGPTVYFTIANTTSFSYKQHPTAISSQPWVQRSTNTCPEIQFNWAEHFTAGLSSINAKCWLSKDRFFNHSLTIYSLCRRVLHEYWYCCSNPSARLPVYLQQISHKIGWECFYTLHISDITVFQSSLKWTDPYCQNMENQDFFCLLKICTKVILSYPLSGNGQKKIPQWHSASSKVIKKLGNVY